MHTAHIFPPEKTELASSCSLNVYFANALMILIPQMLVPQAHDYDRVESLPVLSAVVYCVKSISQTLDSGSRSFLLPFNFYFFDWWNNNVYHFLGRKPQPT